MGALYIVILTKSCDFFLRNSIQKDEQYSNVICQAFKELS